MHGLGMTAMYELGIQSDSADALMYSYKASCSHDGCQEDYQYPPAALRLKFRFVLRRVTPLQPVSILLDIAISPTALVADSCQGSRRPKLC